MRITNPSNSVNAKWRCLQKGSLMRQLVRSFFVVASIGIMIATGYFLFLLNSGNRWLQWADFQPALSTTSQGKQVAAYTATITSTAGPLRVYSSNPRYFVDRNGKVIYLAGAHTWSNFQDTGSSDPPPVFDYTAYLDFLTAHNLNFFRLWTWEQARWGPWLPGDIYFAPLLYERTGANKALDGKPQFDVTKFNQGYFDRLRQRVMMAREKGIYVSIMLFDGWSIEDKGLGEGNPWRAHPYHRDNNINGIDGDPNQDNQGFEVHTLQVPTITRLQEDYIKKVIDTVNDLDNVLYEISNESHGNSTTWQYQMINFIKSYEADKPQQHPVGMTVEWRDGDNGELFASSADWISPNAYFDPPAADGSKVIIADTDHIWGIGGNREWAWKNFARGNNALFMDPYDCSPAWPPENCDTNNAEWVSLRTNLGYTRAYAARMNLAAMLPYPALASSGYCLANPSREGAEYLVYLPAGSTVTTLLASIGVDKHPSLYLPTDSTVTIDLSSTSGELVVEWFNPETGATTDGGVVIGGAPRVFTAPFTGDAVLYLYQKPAEQKFRLYLPVSGQGTVAVTPAGPYATGQPVMLSAVPAPGWAFAAWKGDFAGLTTPLALTMTRDTTVTALFVPTDVPTYTVTLRVVGQGAVALTAAGPFTQGQTIQIAALPDPSWTFTGWSGNLIGQVGSLITTITNTLNITATFETNQSFMPTVVSE